MFEGCVRIFSWVAILAVTPVAIAQSASELLEKGIYAEETAGELDVAISIYERIVENHDANHKYIARAQYQLGVCYAKKGQKDDAAAAFRKVVEFPDQPALVAQARVRLSNLGFGTNGETLAMATRQVWTQSDDMGAPSPDGRYISFVNWNKGDMAVHDNQTGENRDLTDEGTWGTPMQFGDTSLWSPDSKQIAYLWLSRGDKAEDNWGELRIVGLDGSKPRVLHNSEWEGSAPWPTAWSQDGKYILAVVEKKDESQKRGHEDQIALISVSDGSVRVLKSLGKRHTANMSLSPDGRYVAFALSAKKAPAQRNICLLATNGNAETAVVELEHPADDSAPYWAPDGKHIIFTSNRSGANALWMLEVHEGEVKGAPRLVKKLDANFSPMGFSQDGSFYYSLENSSRNVYVATVDFETGKVSSAPTKISLRFEGSNLAPAWSPDGKFLAYVSDRSGRNQYTLVLQSVDTGEERDLSPESLRMMHAHAYGAPQWSPDGRSILVAGAVKGDRGRNNLYLVDVRTGDFAPIVKSALSKEPLDAAQGWPVFSKDGKEVYFTRKQSIMAHNLKTHEEKELYRSKTMILGFSYPSPDGRQLVFVESETLTSRRPQVLKALSISGGGTNDLYAPGDSWLGEISWTPDGDLMVIERSRNGQGKVLIVPAEGGDAREIDLGFNLGKFSLHPDGQRIAFTRGASRKDIWALENFLPKATAGE